MVRSENDLPKKKGKYIVRNKRNGNLVRYYYYLNDNSKSRWISKVDWYLIESDLQLSMPSVEIMANSIEIIFKNTKRIHGKSEALDWIKRASIQSARHIKSQCKVIDLKSELMKFIDFAEPLYWGENDIVDYRQVIDQYLKQQ